jgi:hypothetical protein
MVAGTGVLGSIAGALADMVDLGKLISGAKETGEDCLFLDVFVPGMLVLSAVRLGMQEELIF